MFSFTHGNVLEKIYSSRAFKAASSSGIGRYFWLKTAICKWKNKIDSINFVENVFLLSTKNRSKVLSNRIWNVIWAVMKPHKKIKTDNNKSNVVWVFNRSQGWYSFSSKNNIIKMSCWLTKMGSELGRGRDVVRLPNVPGIKSQSITLWSFLASSQYLKT